MRRNAQRDPLMPSAATRAPALGGEWRPDAREPDLVDMAKFSAMVEPGAIHIPAAPQRATGTPARITILRARIRARRIILSPAEKAEPMRIGAEFGCDGDGLSEVASPETYRRWRAQPRLTSKPCLRGNDPQPTGRIEMRQR